MIIIGEKINSSIPKTLAAMKARDEKYLQELILAQTEAGADYIDINTALCGDSETENMLWLMDFVPESAGIMLDSPNPDVIAHCLPKTAGRKVIINSITFEPQYANIISLAAEHKVGLVCIPMNENGVPPQAEGRLEAAAALIKKLDAENFPHGDIFIDCIVEAVATDDNAAAVTLETIKLVKRAFPAVKTTVGLSNISFGLPNRIDLNRAFLAMAIQNGLDSAIMDPLSVPMLSTVFAAKVLMGRDEYCMEYIEHVRGTAE